MIFVRVQEGFFVKQFLIDIGSSTIKTYIRNGDAVDLVDEMSILFKDGFSAINGVADKNVDSLVRHFQKLFKKYDMNASNTRTFATGIWREIPDEQLARIKSLFADGVGAEFNVISHEQEAEYLKQATRLDYGGKKVMVINMGGKTTEIVTVERDGKTSTKLLQIGVGDLIFSFPGANESVSAASIADMERFVATRLCHETFDTDYDFALFTGELRFEKLSGYPLVPNTIFDDVNHPFMLTLDEFIAGTERIFFELTMDQLRALMPNNPGWMTGARAGAILPLALFRSAAIKVIVPSDLNMINGVEA
jgi:hypothetical protein